MPLLDLLVWGLWKRFGRQVEWEWFPSIGVFDIEAADSVLDEWDVFLWPQQDFDALPANEACFCEGGDRRGREVVGAGLKSVLAAYGGIDPRYTCMRDLNEQSCSK